MYLMAGRTQICSTTMYSMRYSLPRCCQMMRNDASADTSSRYLAPAPVAPQHRVPATLPCPQPWAQLRNAAYAILHRLQLLACSWYNTRHANSTGGSNDWPSFFLVLPLPFPQFWTDTRLSPNNASFFIILCFRFLFALSAQFWSAGTAFIACAALHGSVADPT